MARLTSTEAALSKNARQPHTTSPGGNQTGEHTQNETRITLPPHRAICPGPSLHKGATSQRPQPALAHHEVAGRAGGGSLVGNGRDHAGLGNRSGLGGCEMISQPYKTRTGKIGKLPVFQNMEEFLSLSPEDPGFCLACGELAYGVEPDARRYECECCEARAVYGLEELLVMGLVKFDAEGGAE